LKVKSVISMTRHKYLYQSVLYYMSIYSLTAGCILHLLLSRYSYICMCVCRYWGVVYSLKYAVLRAVSWFTLVNILDKFKVHNEQLDVKQSSNWRLNKYRRWRSLHEWKIDMYNYNHHKYIIYNYPVYKLGSDTIIVDQKVDKKPANVEWFYIMLPL